MVWMPKRIQIVMSWVLSGFLLLMSIPIMSGIVSSDKEWGEDSITMFVLSIIMSFMGVGAALFHTPYGHRIFCESDGLRVQYFFLQKKWKWSDFSSVNIHINRVMMRGGVKEIPGLRFHGKPSKGLPFPFGAKTLFIPFSMMSDHFLEYVVAKRMELGFNDGIAPTFQG